MVKEYSSSKITTRGSPTWTLAKDIGKWNIAWNVICCNLLTALSDVL